jgi:hypothetical protein
VQEEWVLGPEIEELTDLVRDELRLPWILSRFGSGSSTAK